MSALSTTGLTKHYGGNPAIRDCTVDLPEGKVAGLVGSNGSGKSSLLALAAGLARPTAGTIQVFGDEVRGRLHPDVAYLPQQRPLYQDFTVQDMIRAVGAMNDRWSDERVEEALARNSALDRGAKVGTLSRGTRTQLAIALTLGRLPRLLLLDEPLSDLDPLAREDVLRMVLADVAERGTTVVLSAHLLSELREACDHLLLLHEGRVLLEGDVEELLDDHRDVVGPADDGNAISGTVIRTSRTGRQQRTFVRAPDSLPSGWESQRPDLDGLVTEYLRAERENTGA